MTPERENPEEAKIVRPYKPARHAQADPCRYFTQRPQCWFSRGTAQLLLESNNKLIENLNYFEYHAKSMHI